MTLRTSKVLAAVLGFSVCGVTCSAAFAQTEEPLPLRGAATTNKPGIPSAPTVDSSIERLDPLTTAGDAVAPLPLTGILSHDELIGTATLNKDHRTITVKVSNNGKRALILNGNSAWSMTEKVRQQALLRNQVIHPPSKSQTAGDIFAFVMSIGSLGVIPVAVDVVDKKMEGGVAYYGRDQNRRKLAERRFGQRVLFPGESVKGEVFLSRSLKVPGVINFPVTLHPDGTDLGLLELSLTVPSNTSVANSGDKTPAVEGDGNKKQSFK